LHYLGRLDHQVKLRGVRIELGEIETVLREQESIAEAVVVVREDRPADPALVAYVVPRDVWRPEVVRQGLQERLPSALLPSTFVPLSALPKLSNGKLDRAGLPTPQSVREEAEEGVRTELEELLIGLFGTVLGSIQVGREANFFELGGHSLLATRLMARVRAVFGIEMPLRAVFEAPTVAGLAQRVEQTMRTNQRVTLPPL